ncbi:MAG: ABC transporter ATP-binding protein [Verrucomicrobiae bacterium]|nr:ABC transporter ATP-binding protein [Verrucomicrobiae bacterium]
MIQVEKLEKTFGAQKTLRGVDLSVGTGENLVIIGRSGSGKSVLLKHIAGLIKPDSGRVLIDGCDLVPLTERQLVPFRKKVGIVFQNAALFDSLNVEANIAFPLREERLLKPAEIRDRVAQALDWVEMPGQQRKMPSQLSGGMRKRVGLARALVASPEALMYDEPTAGLDPIVADSINELIIHVCGKFKVTSLTVTHDMVSAYKIADRIVMLHEGRIHFSGTPAEVQACQDPVVHDFVNGISRGRMAVEL